MKKMDPGLNASMFPLQMGNLQPLDFTASQIMSDGQKMETETSPENEPPVLDLSCKRYSPAESPGTYSERSLSHHSADEKMNSDHYVDTERKSPFEGRSYMVTPPSESDSPRKTKYEPIYNQINSTTSDLSMPLYPAAALPMPGSISGSTNAIPSSLPNIVGDQTHEILQNHATSLQMRTPEHHHRVGVVATPSQSPEMVKKVPRPFKAYPKDPLSLTMGTTELICDQTSNEAYSEFRKRMLESVKKTNEGTNIKMRRTTKSPGLPTSTMDEKDAAYWERRRKNNEAAKRSRDARRAKEDEIAIRAAFLEQENIKLKYELVALRNETAKLRCMVYSN